LFEDCNWKTNLSATNIDAEQRRSDTTCIDIELRDRGEQTLLVKEFYLHLNIIRIGKLMCILCPHPQYKNEGSITGLRKRKNSQLALVIIPPDFLFFLFAQSYFHQAYFYYPELLINRKDES